MIESFTGMTDVRLGFDTDINFENGDLMLTTGEEYIALEMYKLLITSPGDWKADPTIGCSPNRFTGETNSREVGNKIRQYLIEGLRKTVFPAQLDIKVVPTGYSKVMIFINLYSKDSELSTLPFEFDFVNGIKKLNIRDEKVQKIRSSSKYKINDISNMKKPNKYAQQIRKDRIGARYGRS